MHKAYHGTKYVKSVLKNGLSIYYGNSICKHICLTDKPEIAAMFGVVVEVDIDGIDTDGFIGGETRVHSFIESERIRLYSKSVKESLNGFIDPCYFKRWNRDGCYLRIISMLN